MTETLSVPAKMPVRLRVNGQNRDLLIEPSASLLQVLREDLALTGTKEVCLLGSCGACTVLIDGKPALSCLVLAMACRGKAITTIEGLMEGGDLHPLQQAFIDKGAVQCGYCTPGMVMVGKALLDEKPNPTAEEARQAIAGNLCRCTGYQQIVEAIVAAPEIARTGSAKRPAGLMDSGPYLMPETGE